MMGYGHRYYRIVGLRTTEEGCVSSGRTGLVGCEEEVCAKFARHGRLDFGRGGFVVEEGVEQVIDVVA